ncbi:zf-HC2 domain-containing protein [Pseudogracilibacillus auburnensis]|uniref:zf-HC2 domain-containing protein n=1 Tax=Pseudogracilibacillus auburnensis TaxID=1494959 RepID=UPI001A95A915|nr:zf-HC2 domain-containing protein [Pseudogracilibacillus auburnensis]MBO1003959.1 zf-HC2 domain-containing protein [Pseudogracilibacillus auburnensis]
MNKDCFIAEDLMPLYNEGLLQDETASWLEAHLKTCRNCRELAHLSKEPVEKVAMESTVNHDKMMGKIKLRLSIYQIIFVGLSFFFAIKTSLLNDSFGFILSYTVLGVLTYLFYKNIWIVIAIAFLPNFIWSLIDISEFSFNGIVGSIFIGVIHLSFALVGNIIGWLILQVRERGEST